MEDKSHSFKRFDLSGIVPSSLMQNILINMVFPYMVYQFITPRAPSVWALLIVSVFPLVGIMYGLRQQRRLDFIGVSALLFILIMAGTTFMIGDPRILWLRYAMAIGTFGLVLLLSLFFSRPIWFFIDNYFSSFSTNQYFTQQQSPRYRSMLMHINIAWGLSQIIAAAILVLLFFVVTRGTYIVLSTYTFYAIAGFYILLILGTLRYKSHVLKKHAHSL